MNKHFAEDLMAKFSELLARSPAKDLERNLKELMKSLLARMDLVTREEFDIQRELLSSTRAKLEALEIRLVELEGKQPAPTPHIPSK